MKTTASIDAARLELLLTELRLPAVKQTWKRLAEQSDKEGWTAARFLAALAEHEVAERSRRASSATTMTLPSKFTAVIVPWVNGG
jgi:DNA replication protein DnaC